MGATMTNPDNRDARRMRLAPRLDLAAASPLHSALLAARGDALTIDLSEVERIGASCAQVLVSAQKTWAADRVPLTFDQPSPEASAQLALLGLDSLLLGASANERNARDWETVQ